MSSNYSMAAMLEICLISVFLLFRRNLTDGQSIKKAACAESCVRGFYAKTKPNDAVTPVLLVEYLTLADAVSAALTIRPLICLVLSIESG